MGLLVAMNVVNGHLRWKPGWIIGFLVARNLVNGNLRQKIGSIIGSLLVARNLGNQDMRSKLWLMIGMLAIRNVVNRNLRLKLGSIMGVMVGRNVVNGNLRACLPSFLPPENQHPPSTRVSEGPQRYVTARTTKIQDFWWPGIRSMPWGMGRIFSGQEGQWNNHSWCPGVGQSIFQPPEKMLQIF